MSAVEAPLAAVMLFGLLLASAILHSLQYAEAHHTSGLLVCLLRCEPATKDRPESFNLFNTLKAVCTASIWRTPRVVQIQLYALSHDHRALQVDWRNQSSGGNGVAGAARAGTCISSAACAGDHGASAGHPESRCKRARETLKWLLVRQCDLVCVPGVCCTRVLCVGIIWPGCGSL